MTDRLELTDPSVMRAYAHPLRLKLVLLLRMNGPHTATQAAKALGDNVPNCSFHLRQLAKYGIVERIEGADHRERPWRATSMTTSWDDAVEDPAMRSASDHLVAMIVDGYVRHARAWLAARNRESVEWRRATGISDYTLHVTADEMADVQRRVDEVLIPYLDRLDEPARRPEGSRAINLVRLAMPWDVA